MNDFLNKKSGAALVIVLGFLAILTIAIVAFTIQSRTERLSGRSFVSAAQTRHLLNTALARAMEDIDTLSGTAPFPPFMAHASPDIGNQFVADVINFTNEEDYFPIANPLIAPEYTTALNTAKWQPIADSDGTVLGRVGYIVINCSGLLDANEVGGYDENLNFLTRGAGRTPREIQLSKHDNIIDEFNGANSSDGIKAFPHFSAETPEGIRRAASDKDFSAGLAFVYNRQNAWKHFESLRDISLLNRLGSPDIITEDIKTFCTHSFDPRQDERIFMGTNSATLNLEAIKSQLPSAAEPNFVLNQLQDYLDLDTIPIDLDRSVEPIPMLNEFVLNLNTVFSPKLVSDGEEVVVESVSISNIYTVSIEVWYPFRGYTNNQEFVVSCDNLLDPAPPPTLLLGDVEGWTNSYILPDDIGLPDSDPPNKPYSFVLQSGITNIEVTSASELEGLFDDLANDISFSELSCFDLTANQQVDRVVPFRIPMQKAVAAKLMPDIEALAEKLFNPEISTKTTNVFSIGKAVIDPRLNWDGQDLDQWVEVGDYGESPSKETSLDKINEDVISQIDTPDSTEMMHLRNADRIDTAFEFTYLLYDSSKPWKTFQMIEQNDTDNTRFVLDTLSTFPRTGKPRHGRINPYSPHTNVLAAVFMNLPTTDFNAPNFQRIIGGKADDAAELFMEYIDKNGWPERPSDYASDLFQPMIRSSDRNNPWAQESFFRNTYELFNPRDTLYTILLAAQGGTDYNNDNLISDNEVRATKQAVTYIWRDPKTEKAACVFFGLSDTLAKETKWKTLLQVFEP